MQRIIKQHPALCIATALVIFESVCLSGTDVYVPSASAFNSSFWRIL